MATRLDRLFLLLDTGSTPVIRKSAAEQLGDVQKLHPHELNNLLSKVHGYLVSTSWETRIAAGHAVEAIAKNVPNWCPKSAATEDDGGWRWGKLTFGSFDLSKLQNVTLMGSEGTQYDSAVVLGLDQKEELAKQKRLLNKRLGLDIAGGMGIATEDLYKEEDLLLQQSHIADSMQQVTGKDALKKHLSAAGVDMSARERNRAKRKAKLMSKTSEKTNGDNGNGEPSSKVRKTNSVVVDQPDQDKVVVDNVPDNTLNIDEIDEWPFEVFCELLMNDLFNPSWECRHGAAVGLRQVVNLHGDGAGKSTDIPDHLLDAANQLWLEDLAVRLICVIALDRFGDFVSDEVVAPVRESCAQALGVVLHRMTKSGVEAAIRVLMQLLVQPHWEVPHGGLLGLKYIFAAKQELADEFLPTVLPAIFHLLQAGNDDVRSVAAASLIPVTHTLVTQFSAQVPYITNCLWDTLNDLDDLSASTNSVMTLLSNLLGHQQVCVQQFGLQPLNNLIPRLWPFLRHTITSVRRAVLQTLITLLSRVRSQDFQVDWLMLDSLRNIFQRCLLEETTDILDVGYEVWFSLLRTPPIDHLISASSPLMGMWMCLAMHPPRMCFNPSMIVQPKHTAKEPSTMKVRQRQQSDSGQQDDKAEEYYIGGATSLTETEAQRDICVTRARMCAAKYIGLLCSLVAQPLPNIPEGVDPPPEAIGKLLIFYLNSKSATQRFTVGQVIVEWALRNNATTCPQFIKERLLACLSESIYYDEIATAFTQMQVQSKDLIACLKQQGVDMESLITVGPVLSVDEVKAVTGAMWDTSIKPKLKTKVREDYEQRRQSLSITVNQLVVDQQLLTIRVQSSIAGAVICLGCLPDKMNPVVRPLMDTVKREENAQLQACAGCRLSQLIRLCVGKTPCPTPKIVKNLIGMLCGDPIYTPPLKIDNNTDNKLDSLGREATCDSYSGILTLSVHQKTPEPTRGRKPAVLKKIPSVVGGDICVEAIMYEEDEEKKQKLVQRRGATYALTTIAKDLGPQLPQLVPELWAFYNTVMNNSNTVSGSAAEMNTEEVQDLVNSLQVLETIGPCLSAELLPKLLELMPPLCQCLNHPYTAVRHMAARCLGMLSKLSTNESMEYILEQVLPCFGASDQDTLRQGAIEAVCHAIDQLGMDLVPYIVLLVVPIMGRMSDQNDAVRLLAAHCFATLIKLMPLEAGIPDPPQMKSTLIERKERERKFLEQLLDGSKIEPYVVPVPIKAELRKYQQDGVNWLAFLNKYKLHGILCDDMGLGKTLQSICLLAGDHHYRSVQFEETGAPDSAPLPSIVICPPTLTGHWVYEIEKFVDKKYLNPLHYTGNPTERVRLQKFVKNHNLVVASYDVVRNDISFMGTIKWNYCILDEGHIIKNHKTKLARAVKMLSCNHRVMLSGTPIQNNVLELWSLFDFLMPGFLGTEKQFNSRYGKPILQSRDAKSSSKEQQAGALAMESLHRQVLPFLLRRLKEDVLKDLPPKIIQDYHCDLSPLQVTLYEDFARSKAKESIEHNLSPEKEKSKRKKDHSGITHVFQALQYLRKVCNHPSLVLTPQHPQYKLLTQKYGSDLRDIQHASKLVALRQLLQDCGIGVDNESTVVNQHRALVFCQHKSMLSIVEKDLLKAHMPSVTFLRLDGSVPAGHRHSIVNRFNNDPSIDLLLLTTHVGGLGLNLTGADTVIFIEHDWNPMKDLQAMDRAHRIGQKKVVNVYRLVTRGTLEEKIMGLQQFKINIANTVISQENSSLASMGTDQLLDLFSFDQKGTPESGASTSRGAEGNQKSTMKEVIDNLEELWDDSHYEEEYDLSNFVEGLKK